MTPTFYPKTKDQLDSLYKEHNGEDVDLWCSAHALPQWIDEAPTPEGQQKVIDRDGDINLDPCRIILSSPKQHIQIEVPLSIYEDWTDDESIRHGVDPRTGEPLQ